MTLTFEVNLSIGLKPYF